jgi:GABA permease
VRRIMIIANQTARGEHLQQQVRESMAQGPCHFYLVVPATPTPTGPHRLVWTEGESLALARFRLEAGLASLRLVGADVDGEVGDPRPMDAIADVLMGRSFDEIIVSTLPAGFSKWLAQDLPHRVKRTFGLPVTHIVGRREAVEPDAPTRVVFDPSILPPLAP